MRKILRAIFFKHQSTRKHFSKMSLNERIIPKEEVSRFIIDCMVKVGAPLEHSKLLASNLVEADYRGHFSHGLNRLQMYVNDILAHTCDPAIKPKIIKESGSTALVNGQNGLGVVVGSYSMNLAIKKSSESGIGLVVARGSNHFGICQWYSEMALKNGFIGMAFTNTSPFLTPTRGMKPFFGTNPISMSAPGLIDDYFSLDMATTGVAVGKIEMQIRKKENLPTLSWALGEDGRPTHDAKEAFERGCGLMPLGGSEINAGYKGYGLGMMVEVLCGLLAGAYYGPNIRKWMSNSTEPANIGQCFICINPDFFEPNFKERLQDVMNLLRNLTQADPSLPVLVPGDPERIHRNKVNKEGGIFYTENHISSYRTLAKELKVDPMAPYNKA